MYSIIIIKIKTTFNYHKKDIIIVIVFIENKIQITIRKEWITNGIIDINIIKV